MLVLTCDQELGYILDSDAPDEYRLARVGVGVEAHRQVDEHTGEAKLRSRWQAVR
jgi:hypothetical protein